MKGQLKICCLEEWQGHQEGSETQANRVGSSTANVSAHRCNGRGTSSWSGRDTSNSGWRGLDWGSSAGGQWDGLGDGDIDSLGASNALGSDNLNGLGASRDVDGLDLVHGGGDLGGGKGESQALLLDALGDSDALRLGSDGLGLWSLGDDSLVALVVHTRGDGDNLLVGVGGSDGGQGLHTLVVVARGDGDDFGVLVGLSLGHWGLGGQGSGALVVLARSDSDDFLVGVGSGHSRQGLHALVVRAGGDGDDLLVGGGDGSWVGGVGNWS